MQQSFVKIATNPKKLELKVEKTSAGLTITIIVFSILFMFGRFFFTTIAWPPVIIDDILHMIGGLYITSLISLWVLSCKATRNASTRLLEEYFVC